MKGLGGQCVGVFLDYGVNFSLDFGLPLRVGSEEYDGPASYRSDAGLEESPHMSVILYSQLIPVLITPAKMTLRTNWKHTDISNRVFVIG